MDSKDIPIFIICRDTVDWLKQLVDRLESIGQQRIYFMDNDSKWPGLLEYYENTPHTVLKMEGNYGHKVAWEQGIAEYYARNEYFVVTDPDMIPDEECPDDFLDEFYDLLQLWPNKNTIGFSLKITDLPDHYEFSEVVRKWNKKFYDPERLVENDRAYSQPLDTTFALYRPGTPYAVGNAFRTAAPYLARHLPWYMDSANIPDDVQFYRDRMDYKIGNWTKAKLPANIMRILNE